MNEVIYFCFDSNTLEINGKDLESFDEFYLKNINELKQYLEKEGYDDKIKLLFPETVLAGIEKPEISILSDKFLDEIQGMKFKNLAFEALKKLLADQIKTRFKQNKIKNERFSKMLEAVIRRYQNRSIDSAQVIQELIEIAKKVREDKAKGKELGLTPEEEAFYDALSNNDSAKKVLGETILKQIASELTELVRKNTSIDWTLRTTVQAKLKVMIKRLLRKYGYPPDTEKIATDLILEQAKLFAEDWAEKETN